MFLFKTSLMCSPVCYSLFVIFGTKKKLQRNDQNQSVVPLKNTSPLDQWHIYYNSQILNSTLHVLLLKIDAENVLFTPVVCSFKKLFYEMPIFNRHILMGLGFGAMLYY